LLGYTNKLKFCSKGSCVALNGEVTFFSFLCIIEVCNYGSFAIMDPRVVREKTTMMSSTPTEQINLEHGAITTNLTKTQFNCTFVVNLS
jgi:hypothetical protein